MNKKKFAEEAALILSILNDAWSDNWGFVPLTDEEIAYVGKKLKPIVFEDLIRIAEVEGEPVAFMITLPDLNEFMMDLNGSLFPFGFVKLLWRLNGGFSGKPKVRTMRVPLMGVVKKLQATTAGEPARLHDDRIHPAGFGGSLWREPGRDRLDPRGQSGHALHRRDDREQGQQDLPDLSEAAVRGRLRARPGAASLSA